MSVVKRIVAGLVGLFSLPVLMFGFQFLSRGVQAHQGQSFYAAGVEGYIEGGLIWMAIALLILLPALRVVLKRDASVAWLALSFLVLILAAMAIPSNTPVGWRVRMAREATERRMESAGTQLAQWAGERQQLPANDAELQSAMKLPDLSPAGTLPTESRYRRAGLPIPYRFVLAANAGGPNRPQPAGDQPAVLYVAVSADRQKYWITATALPDDASREVVMLERDGQLLVTSGEVPPKPPEAAPAPGKKAPRK